MPVADPRQSWRNARKRLEIRQLLSMLVQGSLAIDATQSTRNAHRKGISSQHETVRTIGFGSPSAPTKEWWAQCVNSNKVSKVPLSSLAIYSHLQRPRSSTRLICCLEFHYKSQYSSNTSRLHYRLRDSIFTVGLSSISSSSHSNTSMRRLPVRYWDSSSCGTLRRL